MRISRKLNSRRKLRNKEAGKMEKLVEDITIGERVECNGKKLLITDTYSANGEGVGFISTDENGKEYKFSKSCGTFLAVLV